MVGIGGYGGYYLKTLLEEFSEREIELGGVVDPKAEDSAYFSELKRREIPIFERIEAFYQRGLAADLAVIASPLHFHASQSCQALKYGSRVLCEKPMGATIQEADELIRTKDASGLWVMIGYQWSYSRAIQSLKKNISRGLFGRPIRLKTLCLWTRDDAYYHRNDWAGKIKDPEGRWVLDSLANNALAHFLHNLFYILGSKPPESAAPIEVTAETYRANPIENYDTVACRIRTEGEAELLFYGSHATGDDRGPLLHFEFEDAVVFFGEPRAEILAVYSKGGQKTYGSPEDDHQFLKLYEAVESVHNPKQILCGPEAARPQTLCVNGIQESAPDIVTFPRTLIRRDDARGRWWVEGLDEALLECYEKGKLPSEMKYSWAKRGRTVDLVGYRYFPSGSPPKNPTT